MLSHASPSRWNARGDGDRDELKSKWCIEIQLCVKIRQLLQTVSCVCRVCVMVTVK